MPLKDLTTYLTFDGNCLEAMTFYAEVLGGKLDVMKVGDRNPKSPDADRIMHAHLAFPSGRLMASDMMSGTPWTFTAGNNFALSIECQSAEEQDELFARLAAGGSVTMQVGDMFWGARFGMLKDKFGVAWMFNFNKNTHG